MEDNIDSTVVLVAAMSRIRAVMQKVVDEAGVISPSLRRTKRLIGWLNNVTLLSSTGRA